MNHDNTPPRDQGGRGDTEPPATSPMPQFPGHLLPPFNRGCAAIGERLAASAELARLAADEVPESAVVPWVEIHGIRVPLAADKLAFDDVDDLLRHARAVTFDGACQAIADLKPIVDALAEFVSARQTAIAQNRIGEQLGVHPEHMENHGPG